MKYFVFYLLIINIIAFCLMYVDKEKAKKNKWRIKESTLIMSAVLGGSIGSLLGMNTFRYKTKHNKFKYGIPTILILQIIIALSIYINLK